MSRILTIELATARIAHRLCGGFHVRLFLKHTDLVLPLHEVNVLLDIARERGIEVARILAHTSITSEMLVNPDARVSIVQLTQVVDNALRATADPTLGIEVGTRMHV